MKLRAGRTDRASFSEEATSHPARIPPEASGTSYSRPARRHHDRPVTPEVAGSSPVAPVEFLRIGVFVARRGANDRRLPPIPPRDQDNCHRYETRTRLLARAAMHSHVRVSRVSGSGRHVVSASDLKERVGATEGPRPRFRASVAIDDLPDPRPCSLKQTLPAIVPHCFERDASPTTANHPAHIPRKVGGGSRRRPTR
jgi:hypothetical protein